MRCGPRRAAWRWTMRRSIVTAVLMVGCSAFACRVPTGAQGPASPVELALRAVAQMLAGDWDGAARSYERIIRDNPYRADHWHNYGYALHKTDRHAEAVRAWERALELGFAWDPLWERGLVWDPTWVKAFGP